MEAEQKYRETRTADIRQALTDEGHDPDDHANLIEHAVNAEIRLRRALSKIESDEEE